MKFIADLFDRPIAFHPALVPLTGSVNAALMLGQAVYWAKRAKGDGWFYKTQAEWHDEIALSRKEQENAREKLRERGFMDEELRGVPAKLHFKVNFESLARYVQASMPQTGILDCTFSADRHAPNGHTITETTQRLQTETTNTPTPQGAVSDFAIDMDGEAVNSDVIMVEWNKLPAPFPKIREMTEKRVKLVRQRLKSSQWLNGWREALRIAPNIQFLRGDSGRGWVMDIEFFLKPDSVINIIEGKYGTSSRISKTVQLRENEVPKVANVAEELRKLGIN